VHVRAERPSALALQGLKVHVQSVDRFGCLAALTVVLREAGLTITRAKARPLPRVLSFPHISRCFSFCPRWQEVPGTVS
jgi:hypothetical protein